MKKCVYSLIGAPAESVVCGFTSSFVQEVIDNEVTINRVMM